jgi:hypothetical protein
MNPRDQSLAGIKDEKFALLTMYGKGSILRPIFLERLNASVIHTDQFNTDLLGSFMPLAEIVRYECGDVA